MVAAVSQQATRLAEVALCFLLWFVPHPSHQATIATAAKIICSSKCQQHGDCRAVAGRATCVCHSGWGGDDCLQKCSKQCTQGKCVFVGTQQQCLCFPGFKGEMCSEPGYSMRGLRNLATVVADANIHLPLVQNPQEIVQDNINSKSNSCGANFVCQNGGRCVNGQLGGFKCECNTSKFTGNFCQYVCPTKCENGGSCIRLRRSGTYAFGKKKSLSLTESQVIYRCVCPVGYKGERCEKQHTAVLTIKSTASQSGE